MAEAGLDERRHGERSSGTKPAPPTVIVDHAHVTYRVYLDRRAGLREHVTRRLRGRPHVDVHAIRGVSLTGHQGEAIGVVGHNGSGKSTLMQSIAGVLPVTRGSIYASNQPMLLGVGAALKPNLSGRRNIVIGLLALGLPRREIDHMYDEIVDFSGLHGSINRPLRTYSSGMRARLQFAIATSVQPEILLVDEALAVGDQDFKDRSRSRIDELRANAGTVFLVSHSLSEIRASCSRAIWLHEGELVEDGDAGDVVRTYKRWMRKGER